MENIKGVVVDVKEESELVRRARELARNKEIRDTAKTIGKDAVVIGGCIVGGLAEGIMIGTANAVKNFREGLEVKEILKDGRLQDTKEGAKSAWAQLKGAFAKKPIKIEVDVNVTENKEESKCY